MKQESGPLAAEKQFFGSLVEGNFEVLDQLLSDDFLLVDVMSGGEIAKSTLLAVMRSGQLEFDAIEPADVRVRLYEATAVIVGRTHMKGRFEGKPFELRSRYTHVYVEQEGRWRMVSAQGTPICDPVV